MHARANPLDQVLRRPRTEGLAGAEQQPVVLAQAEIIYDQVIVRGRYPFPYQRVGPAGIHGLGGDH